MAHDPPAAHQEDHPGRRRRPEMRETCRGAAQRDGSITHAFIDGMTPTRTHTHTQTSLYLEMTADLKYFNSSLRYRQTTYPLLSFQACQNVNPRALTSVQRFAAYFTAEICPGGFHRYLVLKQVLVSMSIACFIQLFRRSCFSLFSVCYASDFKYVLFIFLLIDIK